MSFRPPFSNENQSFNRNNNLETGMVQTNTNVFQRNIQNNFPIFPNVNSSNRYPLSSPNSFHSTNSVNATNHAFNNVPFPQRPVNAPPPACHPNLINNRPLNIVNFASQPLNTNPPFHPVRDHMCNRNAVPQITANSNNSNFNFEPRNIPVHRFPPPLSNIAVPPNINYPRFPNNTCFSNPVNVPISLPSLPQFPAPVSQNTTTNTLSSPATYSAGNVNNSVAHTVTYTNPLTIRPTLMTISGEDSSAKLQNNSVVHVPAQLFQNDSSKLQNLKILLNSSLHDKEIKVAEFLAKFSSKKKENKRQVTIPEFRYVIKAALRMIKFLNERKSKLSKLLDANESEWKSEAEKTLKEKEELSTLCSFISAPDHLKSVIEKLKLIKKRRERKKKTKENKLSEKMRVQQKRKERDQEIDKWLDDIKEKNEKIKREAELKKEADFILLEIRRKIYEAKKTIEKIKVFEKLRSARQVNATQKGLHVLSMHNVKFEKKMLILKETMMRQLADYEAEEKALKVMLETEQEGQREEEAQWKIKKMKTLQQKKQNHIRECLFGVSDDPLPTDPLYLFHKYHTSATSSIENLVQIRHQWDIYIAEDGEVIPQHWVVPVAPSNASWEQCLITSKS